MKKPMILVAGLLMCLVASCASAALYLDGYYLPNKPCRPVAYPSGNVIADEGKPLTYTTNNDFQSVLDFYDATLEPQVLPAELGKWQRASLGPAKYLYSCYAADINGMTTETGCVMVRHSESGTTEVTVLLLRSEGSNTPCGLR